MSELCAIPNFLTCFWFSNNSFSLTEILCLNESYGFILNCHYKAFWKELSCTISIKFTTRQFHGGKFEMQEEKLGVHGFLADILIKYVWDRNKKVCLTHWEFAVKNGASCWCNTCECQLVTRSIRGVSHSRFKIPNSYNACDVDSSGALANIQCNVMYFALGISMFSGTGGEAGHRVRPYHPSPYFGAQKRASLLRSGCGRPSSWGINGPA